MQILLFTLFLSQIAAQPLMVDTALVKRLNYEARTAFRIGNFEKNVLMTDSLAQAYADGGDMTGYAIFSMYNGWTHFNELKDYTKAEHYAIRALQTTMEELDGQLPHLDDLYSLLGAIYGSLGNSEKAIEFAQQSIQAVVNSGSTGSFGDYVAHSNLGAIYLDLENYTEALPYFLRARNLLLGVAEKNGWDYRLHLNASELQSKIAYCFLGNGNVDQALQDAKKGESYAQLEDESDHFDFHEIYKALAKVYSQAGNEEEAISYFNKLEDIYLKYFGHRSIQLALLLQDKAEHYVLRDNYTTALQNNTLAIEILGGTLTSDSLSINPNSADLLCQGCEPGLYEQRIRILYDLAQKENFYGYLKACLITSKVAAESIKTIRNTILFREGSKQALFEQFNSIYSKASLVAQQLYELTDSLKYMEEAFHFSELDKANILLESLVKSRLQTEVNLPPEVVSEEKRLSLNILQQESLLEKAINTNDSLKVHEILTGGLFQAKQQYEHFLHRLNADFPEYYDTWHQIKEASLREVSSQLDIHTLLISYMSHPEVKKLQIFSVGSDTYNLQSIPWNDQIEDAIRYTHNALPKASLIQHNRRLQFISQSHLLYKTLISPIIEALEDKSRVIIIPDGTLSFIPFETLLPTAKDTSFSELDFLIRHLAVSYHYSATIYLEGQSNLKIPENEILAFAPVFTNGSYITALQPATRSILADSLEAVERTGWRPLPGSEKEVNEIADLFNDSPHLTLIKEEANEKNLKNALSQSYRYIHMATHSFPNYRNAKFSGIACAQIMDSEGKEDNILYVNEILNMKIQADLIVLSSCESGIGPLLEGEGMMGINRSFLASGIPNVLYSLWKVDDLRSSDLMIAFYKELIAGKTYSEALRNAKLQMLSDTRNSLPAYWSSFALIGR